MAELCIVLLIWLVCYVTMGWVGIFLGPIIGVGLIVLMDKNG